MDLSESAVIAAIARPGDTVILCFASDVMPNQFQSLQADLTARLPHIKFVLVSNVSSAVVYRPNDG